MLFAVAKMAQSKTVPNVIPQYRMFRPRLDVMRVQLAATLAALAARPIISLQHGTPECLVFDAMKICGACWTCAAFPVRVIRPDQVWVARRNASGSAASAPDCGLVFVRQLPATKRIADRFVRFLARCCRHQLRLPISVSRLLGNFRSYLWALRRIVVQVGECRLARVSAKAQPTPDIRLMALLANAGMKGCHQ